MNSKKNNRIFFTHGWIFYVSLITTVSPLWQGALFAIILLDLRILVIGMIILLLMLPLPPLHWAMRFIHLKDGRIKVNGLFFALFSPLQYKVNVPLNEISFIEFRFIEGNSKGGKVLHAWIVPCLILMMNDESVERIILLGYSNKQIAKIKHAILEENKEILVLNDWINKE